MELDPTLAETASEYCVGARLSAPALQPVLRLVETELAGPLAVRDMARVVGLSSFHFSREFRRITGDSPYAYIKRRRIARGSLLLAGSDMPIIEIARLVGFRTHAHFTNAFSRAVGVTPRIYRRRYGRPADLSRLARAAMPDAGESRGLKALQVALSQPVDLESATDVQYWCRVLRCTEAALRCAFQTAGPLGGDIVRYISTRRGKAMRDTLSSSGGGIVRAVESNDSTRASSHQG